MRKIVTDKTAVNAVLVNGVHEVIVADHLRNALFSGKKLRIKLGNDPTSPDIHLGRATLLWKLRAFQELGHIAVFIVGDFTGVIGDTSDKESERPMLTEAEIARNVKTYFKQAFKIIDERRTETYYNSKWLKKLGFSEIGRMADAFSLHEFEARENIKKRLVAGNRVSLREVLYPLMQGYDSVAVRADVEIGGTDQKFNLLSGRVVQELYGQEPQDILMTSLLPGLDGRKMSSSWGNTVNITDSQDDMFGKLMSLRDDLIGEYLRLCANLAENRIQEIESMEPRDAKLGLAKRIVDIYHGGGAGSRAEAEFLRVFQEKQEPTDIKIIQIDVRTMPLVKLLVVAGLASSKSDARRLVEHGGVRIAGKRKTDAGEIILLPDHGVTIQVGSRRFARIVPR